jgi:hypothetical protein
LGKRPATFGDQGNAELDNGLGGHALVSHGSCHRPRA